MRKKSWLKDTTFRPYGVQGDEISVLVAEPDSPALGTWNAQTGEVKIAPGQAPEQQLVILIHELLHWVETTMILNEEMKRRVNHDFITEGAFGLAASLVHAGIIKGITPTAWDAFWSKYDE